MIPVDRDESAVVGADPGGIQPEALGVRAPNGRYQQSLSGQLVAALGPDQNVAVAGAFHSDGALLDDGDAIVGEHPTEHVGDLCLSVRRQPADDRDVHTQVGPQLSLLQTDVAVADDHHPPWQVLLLHRGRAGQRHAGQRRARRLPGLSVISINKACEHR
ncbi:hypothetical protein N801_19945 [Knoellia aerolata DSM 18566]|uniref:Uncharacterized protein n=1 Tax=Knoellia aerolata DSM 18566 TaxID=1385519 RepID=A0A0A0JS60_9MICO|nr:hypothetical protein N801_19945 [Knoellia aerolata DSM 18566]